MCRRTVFEFEKAAIDRVPLWQFRHRSRRKDRLHFLFEAARVQPVDVVVTVVREQQSAMLDEAAQSLAFIVRKADELMAGHEEERERHELLGRGGDDNFLGVDGNRRVLDDGVQNVGRHLRVVVPVARFVPQPGEHEFRRARTALHWSILPLSFGARGSGLGRFGARPVRADPEPEPGTLTRGVPEPVTAYNDWAVSKQWRSGNVIT